jgi:uncharacterized protein YcfL
MKVRILLLLTVLFAVGCAKNTMTVMAQQEVQRPPADEAQVIFLRLSSSEGTNGVSLFEVTGGDIEFIGLIVPGARVPYQTKPGKHVFMVVSDAADFMEANLAGGKNYYGVVAPLMGFWKARFSLLPYKNDPSADYDTAMPSFEKNSSSGELVEISPATLAWYEEHKTDIEAKYRKYWPLWQKNTPAEIARRTLAPADGM